MKARLQLGGWIAALAIAGTVLLRTARWPGTADPAAATMAAIQLVAGLLAAYLLVATVLAIRVPRVAPRFVRRLVAAAISGGLALAPVGAGAATRPRAVSDAPVLTKVADEPTTTTTTTTAAPVASGRDVPAEDRMIPPSSPSEVVVAPGDHLWAIAERVVTGRLGRTPTDAEIAPYWTRLIEENRDRLATGDPDLIFAGQVFRLPS